jgi:hypothetical protein
MWFVFQVGSDVFLCYKKSMNRANLIPYKPGEYCTLVQIAGAMMIITLHISCWSILLMLINWVKTLVV